MKTLPSVTVSVTLSCCLFFSFYGTLGAAVPVVDSITILHSLSDGMTLDSINGTFQLGFFNPGNSRNSYLGIWYKNIPVRTVVWVANRQTPITDSSNSSLLKMNRNGELLLLSKNTTIWSAMPSRPAQVPVLQLLDSGNLVVRDQVKDESDDNFLWQSFDYPTDTLLPGMKLGKDFRTGIERHLTAWKNQNDPSPGNLSWGMHIDNFSEPVMWLGSNQYCRGGPWNGLAYSGKPTNWPQALFEFTYVSNENETYYMYFLSNKSAIARRIINETTLTSQPFVWLEEQKAWKLYLKLPRDDCDLYGHCGANGNCNYNNSPAVCDCLKGFKPKSSENWEAMNYSEGCVLDRPLRCQTDEFVKYQKLKLPDTTNSWVDKNMTLNECRQKCLHECSCMAYANSDIRGTGSGCAIWFGHLVDIRVQPDGGQDLYIRSPASNSVSEEKSHGSKMNIVLIVGITGGSIPLLVLALCWICRSRMKNRRENSQIRTIGNEEHKSDLDLPFFDLSKIAVATDNFSVKNKLGEGGFGAVFRGKLEDGQEIAVKKLSRGSKQGIDEFKNEAMLLVELQHRNLVKLVGYSIQGEEKLLIYEYMANKSLDSIIYDESKGKTLDWSKRFHIIDGIARGLLYLHHDSRLKVIHRDLKASNILLDGNLNPKISDFGMARAFGGEQIAGNTTRVVGTQGYMAPEYAVDGHFSTKSDVFSFGVLMLEIISGKKNRGLHFPANNLNLIAHAWNLWKEEKAEELVDGCIRESSNVYEAIRSIHISLLCLQHDPEERPSMSNVVLMLSGRSCLPEPKQAGFLLAENIRSASVNGLSITALEAR